MVVAVATVVAAAVAETATEPRVGIRNHGATMGGPSFLFALIQAVILEFNAWNGLLLACSRV